MRLYQPPYFKEFSCLADKCRHTCCLGWDIGVDDEVYGKIRASEEPLLKELFESISSEGDGLHITRRDDGRCPFLDCGGLCRLISSFGDEYLPTICREHPRFYNEVADGYEVGLGLSCEGAARLVLWAGEFYPLENSMGGPIGPRPICERDKILESASLYPDFDAFRDELVAKYRLGDIAAARRVFCDALDTLEYMDDIDRCGITSLYDGRIGNEYAIRFFAYMLYRHMRRETARRDLLYSILMTERFVSLGALMGGDFDSLVEAARILSSEIEYSPDNEESILFEIDYFLI